MAGSTSTYLLIISERVALAWILATERMAFPGIRRRDVASLRPGDALLLYTTRGCFHNPTRDRGRVIGEAEVVSKPVELDDPVELGGRKFSVGCRLRIIALTELREGIELAPLVPRLTSFPDDESWTVHMRRPLLALASADAALLRRRLARCCGSRGMCYRPTWPQGRRDDVAILLLSGVATGSFRCGAIPGTPAAGVACKAWPVLAISSLFGGITWSGGGSNAPARRSSYVVGKSSREIGQHLPASRSGHASEAIIRDLARVDAYPELDDRSWGISPCFKVETKGLYHRGLEVFLSIEELVIAGFGRSSPEGWPEERAHEDVGGGAESRSTPSSASTGVGTSTIRCRTSTAGSSRLTDHTRRSCCTSPAIETNSPWVTTSSTSRVGARGGSSGATTARFRGLSGSSSGRPWPGLSKAADSLRPALCSARCRSGNRCNLRASRPWRRPRWSLRRANTAGGGGRGHGAAPLGEFRGRRRHDDHVVPRS
jgi:hypothetical protein